MPAALDARKTTIGATCAGSIQGTPSGECRERAFRAVSSSVASTPVGAAGDLDRLRVTSLVAGKRRVDQPGNERVDGDLVATELQRR